MKHPVKMPALSDTMETGRLLRWMKQAGDPVAPGDALAEVETDKSVMELEAFEPGVLRGPLASEDQEYPVGETLAWIGSDVSEEEGEQTEASSEEAPPKEQTQPSEKQVQSSAEAEPVPESAEPPPRHLPTRAERTTGRRRVPQERSAEASRGGSPVLVQAMEGRTAAPRRPADTDAALQHELAAGPPYELRPPLRLRQVISTTVSRSVHVPQFRISTRVDLGALKAHAEQKGWSMTLLLVRACALTLREHPDFNAAWTPQGLAWRERVDVAIAMEAEQGLLTPVLRDAAGRSVPQLADDWNKLKEKIRQHKASPESFRGASFYLSNLGMFPEVMQFDAIVPPGAAAILAVAAPGDGGTVLTLTCDHRVVFGADAARFLEALAKRMRHPAEWAE